MTSFKKLRVLVLGASGMLGSTIFRILSKDANFITFGSIRSKNALKYFSADLHPRLLDNICAERESALIDAFSIAKPDVVINCIGIIKQLPNSNDHLSCLAINSTLPHRIHQYCKITGSRLVHFSTDCVFSGISGRYTEGDFPDSYDLYGRTKYLGEIGSDNAITLRTSIIGHELGSKYSLVDWFLNQTDEVKGYTNAIFSGLPTVEVARVLKDIVLKNPMLNGLYHLSVDPIDKCQLLNLISSIYHKSIKIIPDESVVIDRSLNSNKFRSETGYVPKSWSDLVQEMNIDYVQNVMPYSA